MDPFPDIAVMSSLQFRISRRAADAVGLPALRHLLRAARFPHNSIRCSTHRAPPGTARITCSREIALLLLEKFRALGKDAEACRDSPLQAESAAAVAAILTALDADRPEQGSLV